MSHSINVFSASERQPGSGYVWKFVIPPRGRGASGQFSGYVNLPTAWILTLTKNADGSWESAVISGNGTQPCVSRAPVVGLQPDGGVSVAGWFRGDDTQTLLRADGIVLVSYAKAPGRRHHWALIKPYRVNNVPPPADNEWPTSWLGLSI